MPGGFGSFFSLGESLDSPLRALAVVKKWEGGGNSSKFEIFATNEILNKALWKRKIGCDTAAPRNARRLCASAVETVRIGNAEVQGRGGGDTQ